MSLRGRPGTLLGVVGTADAALWHPPLSTEASKGTGTSDSRLGTYPDLHTFKILLKITDILFQILSEQQQLLSILQDFLGNLKLPACSVAVKCVVSCISWCTLFCTASSSCNAIYIGYAFTGTESFTDCDAGLGKESNQESGADTWISTGSLMNLDRSLCFLSLSIHLLHFYTYNFHKSPLWPGSHRLS